MNHKTVLVVEDDKDLREVYGIILRQAGYTVEESPNGLEALKVFKNKAPNLVLLDISMPVMDGQAFLQQLDRLQYPDTMIIVCSNTSDKIVLSSMLKLGADKIVTKAAIGPSDLIHLIQPYFVS